MITLSEGAVLPTLPTTVVEYESEEHKVLASQGWRLYDEPYSDGDCLLVYQKYLH